MDSHVLTTGHVAPSQEGVGRALPGVEVGGDGVVAARAGGLGQVLREAAGVCPVSHGVGCGGGQVGHLGPQQRGQLVGVGGRSVVPCRRRRSV